MGLTVISALAWWAKDTPDTIALSVDDRTITYRDLYAWTKSVARKLKSLDLKKGERVGILSMNNLEYCVLLLGVIDAGGIAVPLSFRFTAAEFEESLNTVQPKMLFADEERMQLACAFKDRVSAVMALSDLADWKDEPGEDETLGDPVFGDEPAFLFATSGSTASPKYIIYGQRSPVLFACELALQEPSCARGARSLNIAPFSSGGCLVFAKFLVLGHTQYIETNLDAQRALDLIANVGINVVQVVPIFYERISRLPGFAERDLSSLRFATVGGAPVSAELLRIWREKGVTLRQLYGQMEAGGAWEARDTALTEPEKCGRGGIFTRFGIGDPQEQKPPGEVGEILVRGPTVMLGYWNNPEETKRALNNGWLRTSDLGVLDTQGNVTFVDRIKDIIISGGLNISAAEVERVIAQIDGVEEVAVIGARDPEFGETPLAIIFADKPIDVEEIIAHCNARLSNFKVPRYVVMETEPLPRIGAGKLSKPQLRAKYANAAAFLKKVR